jgi:hypothetical protein
VLPLLPQATPRTRRVTRSSKSPVFRLPHVLWKADMRARTPMLTPKRLDIASRMTAFQHAFVPHKILELTFRSEEIVDKSNFVSKLMSHSWSNSR